MTAAAPPAAAPSRPFTSFPELSPPTLALLAQQGFTAATPVQEAVIPLLSAHSDVAADAATGSGKTLAFVLPLVERLRRLEAPLGRLEVAALILSPTRELAAQIHRVLVPYLTAAAPWARCSLLVGGSDPAADAARVVSGGGEKEGVLSESTPGTTSCGAHVLVGTPGRVADTLARLDGSTSSLPRLTWRSFDLLVLDEADRLLDSGFAAHVGAILARLPKQRRTGLFSATQTDAVAALARAGLRNAVRVRVSVASTAPAPAPAAAAPRAPPPPSITPASLTIFAVTVPVDAKPAAVAAFLAEVVGRRGQRVIVYFLTCACVDLYAAVLPAALKAGAQAARKGTTTLPPVALFPLHGRMKQRARDAAVASFTACTTGAALLATDVAARGLDLPALDWTLQADAPQDPDAFVHRVGRSARAGRPGCALALLAPHEGAYAEFLKVRRVPLTPGGPSPDLFGGWGEREAEEEDAAASTSSLDAPPFSFTSVAPAVNAALRTAASTDRAVMEAGTRAFVSYVRGYREHRCRFIFRAADLPLGRLATASAILKLPRMPELGTGGGKGARPVSPPDLNGWTAADVDVEGVPFKDRAREKARRKRVAEAKAAAAAAPPPSSTRPPPTPTLARPPPLERRLPAAKRRTLGARQDEEDFAADYALLRKRKRGKIGEAELEDGLLRKGQEEGSDSDGLSDDDGARPPAASKAHAGGAAARRGGGHKGGRRGGFVPARR